MSPGEIFKTLAWDPFVRSYLIPRLFAALPFLNAWPFSAIATWAVVFIADKIYEGILTWLQLSSVLIKNDAHRRAFDREALKLRALDKEGASQEEFQRAIPEAQARLSDFVRYGVARGL